MARWIVACVFFALLCGNQSESDFDEDERVNSSTLEAITDSYESDSQHVTNYKSMAHRKNTPKRNQIETKKHIHTTDNKMTHTYTEEHNLHRVKPNHPMSDLIFNKKSFQNQHGLLVDSERVKDRRKKIRSTPGFIISKPTHFSKESDYVEYNSAPSDHENRPYTSILKNLEPVTHKKKRQHVTTKFIENESELDASNDKFLIKMKRQKEKANKNLNRMTKNTKIEKISYNKDKHRKTKQIRQHTLQPEGFLQTSGKKQKHDRHLKLEPRIDLSMANVLRLAKENKLDNKNSIKHKNKYKNHKQKHQVRPEKVVFTLKDVTLVDRHNKPKNNKNHSPKPQLNSLELEDALTQPNELQKISDDHDLKDEFTLTVVDVNGNPEKLKAVYMFRDAGKQIPITKRNGSESNVMPINKLAASEQGQDYILPVVASNKKMDNRETQAKPVKSTVPTITKTTLPEVEIGIHDYKNKYKQNATAKNPMKDKINIQRDISKSNEALDDFSKAELYLTETSEESDDEPAFIGYMSGMNGRDKFIDILKAADDGSSKGRTSRKNWLSCFGKKAQKMCIKSCRSAYKNVCKRLKCTSKAKKDLKQQCKKSCKKTFRVSEDSDKSDSSAARRDSESSGSSDSIY